MNTKDRSGRKQPVGWTALVLAVLCALPSMGHAQAEALAKATGRINDCSWEPPFWSCSIRSETDLKYDRSDKGTAVITKFSAFGQDMTGASAVAGLEGSGRFVIEVESWSVRKLNDWLSANNSPPGYSEAWAKVTMQGAQTIHTATGSQPLRLQALLDLDWVGTRLFDYGGGGQALFVNGVADTSAFGQRIRDLQGSAPNSEPGSFFGGAVGWVDLGMVSDGQAATWSIGMEMNAQTDGVWSDGETPGYNRSRLLTELSVVRYRALDAAGNEVALLSPVPEPGGWALMLSGLALLPWRRRAPRQAARSA